MLKYALLIAPFLAAIFLTGCTSEESVSDEDFLETIRAKAENAPPPATYKSHTAIASNAAVPKIDFEVDKVVIHDVPYDGTGEERIKIYNRGEGTLEITNVATSCNCTVGRVENMTVPPGGETDLIITIYPKKIPGFEATRMLTISSNDPNMTDFGLPVTSYITPELELVPESMNLGAIQAGKGYERRYLVRQLIDDPVTISDATVTSKYIDTEIALRPESEWAQPGHREYDVTLKVHPDSPIARLDSRLVLDVDLARIPQLKFDITGVVHTNPYSVVPRTAIYSDVAPGTTLESAYTISADSPITVTSTESDGDSLQLSHRQGENPNEIVFDLTLAAGAASPSITQLWNLTLELDGKTYMEQLAARISTTATVQESD